MDSILKTESHSLNSTSLLIGTLVNSLSGVHRFTDSINRNCHLVDFSGPNTSIKNADYKFCIDFKWLRLVILIFQDIWEGNYILKYLQCSSKYFLHWNNTASVVVKVYHKDFSQLLLRHIGNMLHWLILTFSPQWLHFPTEKKSRFYLTGKILWAFHLHLFKLQSLQESTIWFNVLLINLRFFLIKYLKYLLIF